MNPLITDETKAPLSELQVYCVRFSMKMFGSESCQVLFHKGDILEVCKVGPLWCGAAKGSLVLCPESSSPASNHTQVGGKYQNILN